MIKAENISKQFNGLQVLKNVSLEIKKGEVVAIVGSSGAGKTTLLQILGVLDAPEKNTDVKLTINDINVLDLKDKQLAAFRNKNLGFIFQFHQLLPEFTALENVCIPAFILGKTKAEAEKEAKELLDYLGLSHRINHFPSELSGGEQQRVAVARALINKPAVIFADEPSGSLDSDNKTELHALFFSLREQLHQTFVIVTHDEQLASVTDRIVHMKDGLITNNIRDNQ